MKVTTNLTETRAHSITAGVDTTTVYRWQHSGAEISVVAMSGRADVISSSASFTYTAHARLCLK